MPTNLPAPETPNSSTLEEYYQGVRGTVIRLSGDFMPTSEDTTSRNQRQLVQTTVWIFSGRIPSTGSPKWSISQAHQHPNLVGWTTSDAEGNFSVGLLPGEYTFFAQYGSDLYLNSFSGDGNYKSVPVREGETTEIQLINTEEATF